MEKGISEVCLLFLFFICLLLFLNQASLDSDFLRRLAPLSYLNLSLKDYITDRLLPPPGLVPFLWACFRQVLGDVCQTVSFFSYLLQALFKILQLFLLIVRSTVEPLDLSGERWTLHSTLENTKTGYRLIQNAIIVLQHHISICSYQWEKSMILRRNTFVTSFKKHIKMNNYLKKIKILVLGIGLQGKIK